MYSCSSCYRQYGGGGAVATSALIQKIIPDIKHGDRYAFLVSLPCLSHSLPRLKRRTKYEDATSPSEKQLRIMGRREGAAVYTDVRKV